MPSIPSYDLSDKDFLLFSRLVYEKCGIHLHEGKKELVRSRLSKRLRELELPGFGPYLRLLAGPDAEDELVRMLDAISTNLTSFFREKRHFDFLESEALAGIRERMSKEGRQDLQVWSAGCSSGEEPYSLAICLSEALGVSSRVQIKILATDLSSRMLEAAQSAIYPHARVAGLSQDLVRRYFLKGKGRMQGRVRLRPEIRNLVTFRRFNLMEPFHSSLHFDVIFCRNVMIYFDKPTQEMLVGKFHKALRPGGYLFIGHSESLMGIEHGFRYVQPTIYLKN
ncbi:protein-glutamate O-methyltransferase [Desulfobotulus sp.]|jgi:chemotaxis protein methyltransferase CheR|uniref:CheR family methyltransferase n=1 Tax=Desulfobotulus sp. TaxID=1940337 RepID=UPI002A36781D|nr:protein-glutamate O-methyltransferase [Desulfobotulus sp.]MDY0163668.1 protein-glutamate O-methyltransferase [Desulfobotulus sp.]